MTPFVPFPDGAQVEIGFNWDSPNVENRLWFVNQQPPTTLEQLQALADGVAGWYVDQMLPLLSQDISLASVLVHKWDDHEGDTSAQTIVDLPGGFAGESHSANVADRIWFISAFSSGRIRNSNFIPGIPKAVVNLNTVDPSWRSDVRDAYINLIDLADGFGPFPAWKWVCASSWHNKVLRMTQRVLRTDFIVYKRPWVAQRRKRLPLV